MKKGKNKIRKIIVITFLVIFAISTYVSVRGSYLEYKELGDNYIQTFYTNQKFNLIAFFANFIFLYVVIYLCNKGIHKSLKAFFDDEKKEMPKLANKSIALIISTLVSILISGIMIEKIILCASNVSFEIKDPIFNLDVSYYMFIKPTIEMFIFYFLGIVICTSIYMILYHIIVFNVYLGGIDKEILKNSILIKKLLRNIIIIAIGLSLLNLLSAQNIVLERFLEIESNGTNIELVGAGYTEATIKLWGYAIFSTVIIMAAIFSVKYIKQGKSKNVLLSLSSILIYRVLLFLVLILFDLCFVNANELDKEKQYIEYNIDYTKQAYGINIEEENIKYSGTITEEEVLENKDTINNITIISEDAVLATLQENQTENGYYTYKNVSLAECEINGENQLVYIVPKEAENDNKTYENRTYEFTHGHGEIIVSATDLAEDGTIKYLQKYIEDGIVEIEEPRIYFGMQTNTTIATSTTNKKEYDYTDKDGNDYTYSYTGKAGLQLGFVDRLVLALDQGNLKLAFSDSVDKNSKILTNRNIIKRAKTAIPYLMYDENPYTVVGTDGKIYWVLDAYTTSNKYPYSTHTLITYNGQNKEINYIRNSVKVIIDAYNGTMKFYITDNTDPLAIAYQKIYPEVFEDIGTQLPENIIHGIKYSQYLYDVQATMLATYHNVKPDILYRSSDVWNFAKYYSVQTTNTQEEDLTSYYTMLRTTDSGEARLGLVQMYSQSGKANIISYLVATMENGTAKLKLYKLVSDSNIIGPTQLEKQIEQDETISKELSSLNKTGVKITKKMTIVPVNDTLLYVESIYQTMVNINDTPVLKKIIVASGNKVAIGNDLKSAMENLLSKSAVDIDIETLDNIDNLIDAIIKSNNNLEESMNNNNWEMIGTDIEELQKLINTLEALREKELKNN